jgi:hypothetical protein
MITVENGGGGKLLIIRYLHLIKISNRQTFKLKPPKHNISTNLTVYQNVIANSHNYHEIARNSFI